MDTTEAGRDGGARPAVTALELFFDLVFVFAFIQVTTSIVEKPTLLGVFRGMLVLAALCGAAYLLVRVLHLVLSAIVAQEDAARRSALVRFLPTSLLGPLLILAAAFLDGSARISMWIAALAIDYLGPAVIGMGRGWHVEAEHFAERHGLIVMIALGESIIAIGFGTRDHLDGGILLAAALAVGLVTALWWLYFDVAVIFPRQRLMRMDGIHRARLARDSYSYLHLPMVAGIVLLASGVETTLHHVGEVLPTVAAAGLCGGAALYLVGSVAFLFRATGHVFRMRSVGAGILLALILAAIAVPSVAALALVSAVCWLIVVYEATRHHEARLRLRGGEDLGATSSS